MVNSRGTSRGRAGGRVSRGFTLVEMMLVLVIIGILAAVSVPAMANSIRGNRLRLAASSVVRANRYARSMAIMSQKEVLLSFYPQDPVRIAASGAPKVRLDKVLDGVRITGIDADGVEPSAEDGSVAIPYARNGRCRPYSITLADSRDNTVTVEVDALCGAKTRKD